MAGEIFKAVPIDPARRSSYRARLSICSVYSETEDVDRAIPVDGQQVPAVRTPHDALNCAVRRADADLEFRFITETAARGGGPESHEAVVPAGRELISGDVKGNRG